MKFEVELGVLKDERGVILYSDRPLPYILKRVEYYRDDCLIMLVYFNPDYDSDLLHYEVPNEIQPSIEKSPDIYIYSLFKDHKPIGYKVPLVQVHGETATTH